MKKIKKIVAITLFVSFLLGSTVSAAPMKEQAVQSNEPTKEAGDNEVITNPFSTYAISRTPSMQIYSIKVWPLYYLESTSDETRYYGLKSYTMYQPSQYAYPFGLSMKITPAQKAAMDKAVLDRGYIQAGYYYVITINSDRSLLYRRFEFTSPAGLATHSSGSSEISFDVHISRLLANPNLSLSGKYYYIESGKQQSASFSASAIFEG